MSYQSTNVCKPKVVEISRQSKRSLLDKLLLGESVHKADFEDFVARFSNCLTDGVDQILGNVSEKHIFGVFDSDYDQLVQPDIEPAAFVSVRLCNVAESAGGKIDNRALPGDILAIKSRTNPNIDSPNTAVFYSISSLGHPLKGLPEGTSAAEYLIKQTAKLLQERYGIKKFCTLSPLRQTDKKTGSTTGFRQWLDARMESENCVHYLTRDEEKIIRETQAPFILSPRLSVGKKFLALVQHQNDLGEEDRRAMRKILRSFALDYLIGEANKSGAKDRVERFHLGNGALLGNIHVRAPNKTTEDDWNHAYGVMVNYVYDLDVELLKQRKSAFKLGTAKPYSNQADERGGNRIAASAELLLDQKHRSSQLIRDNMTRAMYPETRKFADMILADTGADRARRARAL